MSSIVFEASSEYLRMWMSRSSRRSRWSCPLKPHSIRGEPFRLAIEDGFLERLSDEELDAAMAHELGHVWVFTHHPYLQTEKLANQIAMRVVTRDSLVSVYHKLWEHGGTKGNIESFLGPASLGESSRHSAIRTMAEVHL